MENAPDAMSEEDFLALTYAVTAHRYQPSSEYIEVCDDMAMRAMKGRPNDAEIVVMKNIINDFGKTIRSQTEHTTQLYRLIIECQRRLAEEQKRTTKLLEVRIAEMEFKPILPIFYIDRIEH